MVAILILFCLILTEWFICNGGDSPGLCQEIKLEEMASKGDVKAESSLRLTENPELFLRPPRSASH